MDFLIIFKSDVNPFPVVNEIEQKFQKHEIYYDMGWYTEIKFIELLQSKIDLCLWWSIFTKGDIIHAEKNFLRLLRNTFKESNPHETFNATFSFRKNKATQQTQSIIRNLHRIVIDGIWTLHFDRQKKMRWNDLPAYERIVDIAVKEGIISKDVELLAHQLEKLRKNMENSHSRIDFAEIEELWTKTIIFANELQN